MRFKRAKKPWRTVKSKYGSITCRYGQRKCWSEFSVAQGNILDRLLVLCHSGWQKTLFLLLFLFVCWFLSYFFFFFLHPDRFPFLPVLPVPPFLPCALQLPIHPPPLFLFKKVWASHEYQPAMLQQFAIKLGTCSPIKIRQDNLMGGKSSQSRKQSKS